VIVGSNLTSRVKSMYIEHVLGTPERGLQLQLARKCVECNCTQRFLLCVKISHLIF